MEKVSSAGRRILSATASITLMAAALLVGTAQPAAAGSGTVSDNCGSVTLTWKRDTAPGRAGYATIMIVIQPTAEYAARVAGRPISITIPWHNLDSGATSTLYHTDTVVLQGLDGYSLAQWPVNTGNGRLEARAGVTINLADGGSCWSAAAPLATARVLGVGPYTVRGNDETAEQAAARLQAHAIDLYQQLEQAVLDAGPYTECEQGDDWPGRDSTGYFYHWVVGFCE